MFIVAKYCNGGSSILQHEKVGQRGVDLSLGFWVKELSSKFFHLEKKNRMELQKWSKNSTKIVST